MTTDPPTTPEAALHAFIAQYWRDEDEGGVRPLAEYLARFPDHQDAVARAYLSLAGDARNGAADDAPEEAVGRDGLGRIAHYRLIRTLGRGGQGEVFLAEDTRLGRNVALKTLNGFGTGSDEQLGRFRREAEAASRLEHPNICTIYDTGEARGIPFITMRYVAGDPLSAVIKTARDGGGDLNRFPGESSTSRGSASASSASSVVSSSSSSPSSSSKARAASNASGRASRSGDPSSVRDRSGRSDVSSGSPEAKKGLWAVRVVEAAARALQVAHDAGIVHRDVKPGNILITPAGEPMLLDFGLARDLERGDETLTQPGDLFGTPAYMSPEQLLGTRTRIDPRTDVYSLGLVLYECLTLENPFAAATRDEIYRAIQVKDPPDPRKKNPHVSADLRVVIDTALEKDRDRRYQSALAFAEDLRRVRMFEPIAARPAGVATRVGRWFQRNPGVAAFALTVFTLLAAGLAIALVLLGRVQREKADKDRALANVESALQDVLRLSDLKRLRDLEPWADRLWPARAEHVAGDDGMDAWIREAEGLVARLPEHENALAALDAGEGDSRARGAEAAWQLESLRQLIERVRALPPTLRAMRDRRTLALGIAERTVGRYRDAWRRASAAVLLDDRFGGLVLEPQVGLVPLGPDPTSRLEEFVLLETGASDDAIPGRGDDGRLIVTEHTGIVFVLVPGGTFTMGALPRADASHPAATIDAQAGKDEGPPHAVTLAPFFIAKHETTQGQWTRITGSNPSVLTSKARPRRGKAIGLRHPVEHLSWRDARDALRRVGALLPTEAQWEYATRAGTTTVWWTGDDAASLRGAINLADGASKGAAPADWALAEGVDDGYVFHAPVGTYRANAFGLHDVHGNVWEWCRDRYGAYSIPPRPGDGLRPVPADVESKRIFRGGGYFNLADKARSANRSYADPEFRNHSLGVRAVRPVTR